MLSQRIKEAVETNDFETIVRTYNILVHRILKFTPPKSRARALEEFDIVLFAQSLQRGLFDWDSLRKLTNTTYKWIHALQMPIRDSSTELSRQRVLTFTGDMSDAVSLYVVEVHNTVETLENDIKEFMDNINNPVVQTMLQEAVNHLSE